MGGPLDEPVDQPTDHLTHRLLQDELDARVVVEERAS